MLIKNNDISHNTIGTQFAFRDPWNGFVQITLCVIHYAQYFVATYCGCKGSRLDQFLFEHSSKCGYPNKPLFFYQTITLLFGGFLWSLNPFFQKTNGDDDYLSKLMPMQPINRKKDSTLSQFQQCTLGEGVNFFRS